MKKILFIAAVIFVSTISLCVAQGNYVNMQQELQRYYNELYKTPEQEAQEAEFILRQTTDPQLIRSQLEKLRYALYQVDKQGIPETQKTSQKRNIEREIEYYEYRLRKYEEK